MKMKKKLNIKEKNRIICNNSQYGLDFYAERLVEGRKPIGRADDKEYFLPKSLLDA